MGLITDMSTYINEDLKPIYDHVLQEDPNIIRKTEPYQDIFNWANIVTESSPITQDMLGIYAYYLHMMCSELAYSPRVTPTERKMLSVGTLLTNKETIAYLDRKKQRPSER